MTLILSQTKFEAVPPKDVGGDAFLVRLMRHIKFGSDFEIFEIPLKKRFQKCMLHPTPPLVRGLRPWTLTRALPCTHWGAQSAPSHPADRNRDLRPLHGTILSTILKF